MGLSWSAMRKVLEQDNICDSLKGRIQYFVTRYAKSHDEQCRVAIRLDGKEIFKSSSIDRTIKRVTVVESNVIPREQAESYWDYWDKVHLETRNRGGFGRYGFYNAFHEYHNQSIEKSLASLDPVVRLFAIMDKRVGKRRLPIMYSELEAQPEWLQIFYKLRLEADGIDVGVKCSDIEKAN